MIGFTTPLHRCKGLTSPLLRVYGVLKRVNLCLTPLLAVFLSACGQSHTGATPGVLERYQALKPVLALVTRDSIAVAQETIALRGSLTNGNDAAVRRTAVQLKLSALALDAHSGVAAAAVRALEPHERNQHLRAYLQLIDGSLAHSWLEGRYVAMMSDVAWADPYLTVTSYAIRAIRLSADAVQQAQLAQHDAAIAAALKQRFAHLFRYIPVRTK